MNIKQIEQLQKKHKENQINNIKKAFLFGISIFLLTIFTFGFEWNLISGVIIIAVLLSFVSMFVIDGYYYYKELKKLIKS